MNETADDFHFEQAATLRDGRSVTMRLMRPDDRQRLIDAFARLDRQSVYKRFFSYRKELPRGPLDRIDRIDLVRLAALVVTIGQGDDETVIASGTYVADTAADGRREAEVAVDALRARYGSAAVRPARLVDPDRRPRDTGRA